MKNYFHMNRAMIMLLALTNAIITFPQSGLLVNEYHFWLKSIGNKHENLVLLGSDWTADSNSLVIYAGIEDNDSNFIRSAIIFIDTLITNPVWTTKFVQFSFGGIIPSIGGPPAYFSLPHITNSLLHINSAGDVFIGGSLKHSCCGSDMFIAKIDTQNIWFVRTIGEYDNVNNSASFCHDGGLIIKELNIQGGTSRLFTAGVMDQYCSSFDPGISYNTVYVGEVDNNGSLLWYSNIDLSNSFKPVIPLGIFPVPGANQISLWALSHNNNLVYFRINADTTNNQAGTLTILPEIKRPINRWKVSNMFQAHIIHDKLSNDYIAIALVEDSLELGELDIWFFRVSNDRSQIKYSLVYDFDDSTNQLIDIVEIASPVIIDSLLITVLKLRKSIYTADEYHSLKFLVVFNLNTGRLLWHKSFIVGNYYVPFDSLLADPSDISIKFILNRRNTLWFIGESSRQITGNRIVLIKSDLFGNFGPNCYDDITWPLFVNSDSVNIYSSSVSFVRDTLIVTQTPLGIIEKKGSLGMKRKPPSPTAAFVFDTVCVGDTLNIYPFAQYSYTPYFSEWTVSVSIPNPCGFYNIGCSRCALSDTAKIVLLHSQCGPYTIKLKVFDGLAGSQILDYSCTDSTELHVLPLPTSLSPSFSYSSLGLSVQFKDSTIGATSWSWDFGDGTTSDQQNPSHTYQAPGTYTVCLTVSNKCSQPATICQNITISTSGTYYPQNANNLTYTISGNTILFNRKVELIYISDLTGKIITMCSSCNSLPIFSIPPGFYFLTVKDKELIIQRALVVD